MLPDERTFNKHVADGTFRAGEVHGDWRLISIEWPHAVIAVSAPERNGAPVEYALRFELSNYPQQVPTAQPWDVDANAPLAPVRWPIGGQVSEVFNPGWSVNALYLPCDRLALAGHEAAWAGHTAYLWNPTRDITHYLRIVHRILNRPEYSGVRG